MTGGIKKILEEYKIETIWMLRPWLYAEEIIDRFSRFTSVDNLIKRLKEIYPNIVSLEEIAFEKDIEIKEPFQGSMINEFKVLAPSKFRYLDLIVESEKTPESISVDKNSTSYSLASILEGGLKKAINFLKSLWGEENFSDEDTTNENEMSVVLFATLSGESILLNGDAGRSALLEAAEYASNVGLILPGINRFQVPHHGSRRNLSSELLDKWLGQKLESKPLEGEEKFQAFISASKEDKDHPRKAVIRALIHRGAKVYTTKGKSLCTSKNAPDRANWIPALKLPYPEEQEEKL